MGQARTLVERLYERVDANDLEGGLALFAPDAEFSFPGLRAKGREEIAALVTGMWTAFPEHRHEIVSAVETTDAIALEVMATAVHGGPLVGPAGELPATGRTMRLPVCHVVVVEAGLIASSHFWFDNLDMLGQLGAMPAPASAA